MSFQEFNCKSWIYQWSL